MNQKNLLLGLIVIIGIIAVVVARRDSPGQAEFKRWQRSEDSVRSWRISTIISQNGLVMLRRAHEAICPDQEHIVEQVRFNTAEYIRIADDIYYRKGQGDWVKGKPDPDLFFPFPSPRPCLSDPGQPSSQPKGGAEESRLAIQNDLTKGKIEMGEIKQVGGEQCRDWKVMVMGKERLGNYTVCISESDHLPRQISAVHDSLLIGYEWDIPITVEAPDMTPHTPAAGSFQNSPPPSY